MGSSDSATVSQRLVEFERLGKQRAVVALLQYEDDEQLARSAKLRAAWAHDLGRTKDERAAGPLLTLLESDPVDSVRFEAARSLGEVGSTEAVGPLIAALADPSEKLRCWAADSLGRIGDSRALPSLTAALDSESRGVRAYVADALGKLGDPAVIPLLLHRLDDRRYLVRAASAEGLSKIGDAAVLEELRARRKRYGPLTRLSWRKAADDLEARLAAEH